MQYKPIKQSTAGMVLLSCMFAGQTNGQERGSKPNVLMILVDDLNDWIGCMGGIGTDTQYRPTGRSRASFYQCPLSGAVKRSLKSVAADRFASVYNRHIRHDTG